MRGVGCSHAPQTERNIGGKLFKARPWLAFLLKIWDLQVFYSVAYTCAGLKSEKRTFHIADTRLLLRRLLYSLWVVCCLDVVTKSLISVSDCQHDLRDCEALVLASVQSQLASHFYFATLTGWTFCHTQRSIATKLGINRKIGSCNFPFGVLSV